MRRTVRIVVLVVTVLAVTVLFVLPGRTMLAQSNSLAATRHRIEVLDQENAKLAAQARALQTNARIEQLARSKYGLVDPGEQAYVVLPAAAAPTTAPTTALAPAVSSTTTTTTSKPG